MGSQGRFVAVTFQFRLIFALGILAVGGSDVPLPSQVHFPNGELQFAEDTGRDNEFGSEVRAVVDSQGYVHVNGKVYARRKANGSEKHTQAKASACHEGLQANISYGSFKKLLVLPRQLAIGDVFATSCRKVLRSAKVFGHIAMRCHADLTIEAQVNCGCAAGSVSISLPPQPASSCLASGQRKTPKTISTQLQSSGDLEEGHEEQRPCSAISPQLKGTMGIRCSNGRLQARLKGCRRPVPLVPPPSDESSIVTSVRNASSATTPRRLSEGGIHAECLSLDMFGYFSVEHCAYLQGITYATVAGALLPGTSAYHLNKPYGIYVTPPATDGAGGGEIYIADWENHRVQRWTSNAFASDVAGETVAGQSGIGGDGIEVGGSSVATTLLFHPSDVVLAGRREGCGDLFIADASNGRIVMWPLGSSTGFVIAGAGTAHAELLQPTGLFVASDFTLYVADRLSHRVVVFVKNALDWEYSHIAAGQNAPSSMLTHLNLPADVYLDVDNAVYVADEGNNRVVRWQAGASEGELVGECLGPHSVALDVNGNVFAACTTSHCIVRWDVASQTQEGVSAAGKCGFLFAAPPHTDPGYEDSLVQFWSPSGVFVDKRGDIYVADTANARAIRKGREPLTQWVIANEDEVVSPYHLDDLIFFRSVTCTDPVQVRSVITSDDNVLEPWNPGCSQQNPCPALSAFLGRQFWEPTAVKCAHINVTFAEQLELALQYWTGSSFRTIYSFGGIVSGAVSVIRVPRFDPTEQQCVKGQRECVISNMVGDWQADGDRVMIKLDDCVTGIAVPGFPNGGISSPGALGGTHFVLGNASEKTIIFADASTGENYKICWCDIRQDGASCERITEFQIEIELLRVQGPYETQTMRAYKGAPLYIPHLMGVDLAPGDLMTVVTGGCGELAAAIMDMPIPEGRASSISLPSSDGVIYSWGGDLVLAMPGSYSLCWCRDIAGGECASLHDFLASAGTLVITGPFPGQSFNCVKGSVCTVQVEGVELLSDKAMVLVSCGNGDHVPGFPEDDDGVIVATGQALDEAGERAMYFWGATGDELSQAAVGLYFLCWCSLSPRAATCTTSASFAAEIGVISIEGPNEVEYMVCGLGSICVLDGIDGVNMPLTSRRLLIAEDTLGCGFSGPVPGFPGEFEGVSFEATESGTSFHFGFIDNNLIIPGSYLVCWCSYIHDCTTIAGFTVTVGRLNVKGPTLWDDRVCSSGYDCEQELTVFDPGSSDTMIIVRGSCGNEAKLAVPHGVGTWACHTYEDGQDDEWCLGNPIVGDFEYTLPRDSIDCPTSCSCCVRNLASLTTRGLDMHGVDMRSETLLGNVHTWQANKLPPGGDYTVCWCSNDCVDTQSYIVTVGLLAIAAPRGGVEAECLSGFPCQIVSDGHAFQSMDRIAFVDGPCGSAESSFVPGVPNGGISMSTASVDPFAAEPWQSAVFSFGSSLDPLVASGGIYTLCWCSGGCLVPADFKIAAGQVVVLAPVGSHRYYCWKGQRCTVTNLQGTGAFFNEGDKLRISDDVCFNEEVVSGVPNFGMSLQANETTYSWGETRLSANVESYRLCWCSGLKECNGYENFTTLVGDIVIAGPDTGQFRSCYAGYPCSLTSILGIAFRVGDVILLRQQDGFCGEGFPATGFPHDGFVARPCEDASVDAATGDFSCAEFQAASGEVINMTAIPQKYRMCWCSNTSRTCNGTSSFDSYSTEIGTLTVKGPSPTQQFFCAPGFECQLSMSGESLVNGELFLVQNDTQCGRSFLVNGFPDEGVSEPAAHSFVTWSSALATTTPPADYILCWCPVCGPGSDWDSSNFNAVAGMVAIVGAYPGHMRACSIGDECVIQGIQGHLLLDGDRIMIVDGPCGPGAQSIANFPQNGLSSAATEGGTRYTYTVLGNIVGGEYNICFCAASRKLVMPQTCFYTDITEDGTEEDIPVIEDFLVFVGVLVIDQAPAGPSLQYCVSGAHCRFENIVAANGAPLGDGAQIQVKEYTEGDSGEGACARATVATGFLNASAISMPATENGSVYDWGFAVSIISAQGGTYNLCWKPFGTAHFAYHMGWLEVTGPLGGASFRCTKKNPCRLSDIQGTTLDVGDYYRVMASCGSGSFTAGIERAAMVRTPADELVVAWDDGEFSPKNPRSEMMCWCFREYNCDQPEDFATLVGEITIVGPRPGQNVDCDRGQDCSPSGFVGVSLSSGDRALILFECGTGPLVMGVDPPSVSASAEVGASGADEIGFSWPYVTTTPGIYKMCWCGVAECEAHEPYLTDGQESYYDVEVGIITIQGPNPRELGQDTHVDAPIHASGWYPLLAGVRMRNFPSAQLQIMRRCSTSTSWGLWISEDRQVGNGFVMPSSDGDQFVFHDLSMAAIVPSYKAVNATTWTSYSYRLCWCRGPTELEPYDTCAHISRFRVDLGEVFVVCGPGREPDGIFHCHNCPIGKYKEARDNSLCLQCPSDLHTTVSDGTSDREECACIPGYYFSGSECLICPEMHYCLGYFSSPGVHSQVRPCPYGSGSWADFAGYPATREEDCSCSFGFTPSADGCEACSPTTLKDERGNATCTSCVDYMPHSTNVEYNSSTCYCEPGYFESQPGVCQMCYVGFYCPFLLNSQECPLGRSTSSRGGQSVDECKCRQGYYEVGSDCVPCVEGGIYYKDEIGNEPCSKPCPANSKATAGSEGPENCRCDYGFAEEVDEATGDKQCIELLADDAVPVQPYARLPTVYTALTLDLAKPSQLDYVRDSLASQLGVADSSRIDFAILSFEEADSSRLRRRLQESTSCSTSLNVANGSNGSAENASSCEEDLPGLLWVEASIWSSTYKEASSLRDDVMALNTTALQVSLVQSQPEEFVALEAILPSPGEPLPTVLRYSNIECMNNTAIVFGMTFISATESCKCTLGYEPTALFDDATRIFLEGSLADPTMLDEKCFPCMQRDGQGYYKDIVADEPCANCGAGLVGSVPAWGAYGQDLCVCELGQYRPDPATSVEACLPCPVDSYCTGDFIVNPCPPYESTDQLTGRWLVSQCKCSPGYFRELSPALPAYGTCYPCDVDYYKPGVEDGIGRCSLSCQTEYGVFSSSPRGASDLSQCYCREGSYMDNVTEDGTTKQKCNSCAADGVLCRGAWSTEDGVHIGNVRLNATDRHTPPVATEGFWGRYTPGKQFIVHECLTRVEKGSVCLDNEACSEGHFGLICGSCLENYARDKFPLPCKACPETSSILLVLVELFKMVTAVLTNEVLAFAALSKTETQKNVMTVLLRMTVHWLTQISPVAQFDFSQLTAFSSSAAEEAPVVEENATDTEESSSSFAWPPWYNKMMGRMMALKDILESLSSTQEVLECLIDRMFPTPGELGRTMRLVLPALFWLFYPLFAVGCVICLTWVQSRVLLPVVLALTSPPKASKNHKKTGCCGRKKRSRKKKHGTEREVEGRPVAHILASSDTGSIQQQISAKPSLKSPSARTGDASDQLGSVKEKMTEYPSMASSTMYAQAKKSDDSWFDSSSSDENDDIQQKQGQGPKKKKASKMVHTPKYVVLSDEFRKNVTNPARFSYEDDGTQEQGSVDDDEGRARSKRIERWLQLFRANATFEEMILDAAPWIVITLNNVWNIVTNRLIQLLYCQKFGDFGERLMADTETACWDVGGAHGMLAGIAVFGLLLWSLGIVAAFGSTISKQPIQSDFVQRNFGYLLEGYEPHCWYWEVVWKKVDLLVTAIITYNPVAPDTASKIILYSMQASLAFTVQLRWRPYDNRQLHLLDRVENMGLVVRYWVFTGLAVAMLVSLTPLTMMIAGVLIFGNIAFMLKVGFHMADDWVATQAIMSQEAIARYLDQKRMQQGARGPPLAPEQPDSRSGHQKRKDSTVDVEGDGSQTYKLLRAKLDIFKQVQNRLFFGHWRKHQLLRVEWSGPGADADLVRPQLFDGMPPGTRPTIANTVFLSGLKVFFGLGNAQQLEALKESLTGFIDLLLGFWNFDQMPCRFIDMVCFLSRAVKSMKQMLADHPDVARQPDAPNTAADAVGPELSMVIQDEPRAKPQNFKHLELLKMALLDELYSRLLKETHDKSNLIEELRPTFAEVLKETDIPLEAAWDILDKLTNDQLRLSGAHPAQLYNRVKFNLLLAKCRNDVRGQVAQYSKTMDEEKKARKSMYKFINFKLRARLAEDPDMNWHNVQEVLDMLPLEMLETIRDDPDKAIEQVWEYRQKPARSGMSVTAGNDEFLTIEDLNGMLMFLQKLQCDELHELLEYTQILLDYLTLPTNSGWREELVLRGQMEEEAPAVYAKLMDMRHRVRNGPRMPLVRYAGRSYSGHDGDYDQLRALYQGRLGPAISIAFTARWEQFHSWSRIIDFGDGPDQDNIVITTERTSSTLVFMVYNKDQRASISAVDAAETQVEHRYLCTVSEAGELRMYRDGELLAKRPANESLAPRRMKRANLYVGKSNWRGDPAFQGIIKDIAVWNSAVDWETSESTSPPGVQADLDAMRNRHGAKDALGGSRKSEVFAADLWPGMPAIPEERGVLRKLERELGVSSAEFEHDEVSEEGTTESFASLDTFVHDMAGGLGSGDTTLSPDPSSNFTVHDYGSSDRGSARSSSTTMGSTPGTARRDPLLDRIDALRRRAGAGALDGMEEGLEPLSTSSSSRTNTASTPQAEVGGIPSMHSPLRVQDVGAMEHIMMLTDMSIVSDANSEGLPSDITSDMNSEIGTEVTGSL